jgi:hypothetical protein
LDADQEPVEEMPVRKLERARMRIGVPVDHGREWMQTAGALHPILGKTMSAIFTT